MLDRTATDGIGVNRNHHAKYCLFVFHKQFVSEGIIAAGDTMGIIAAGLGDFCDPHPPREKEAGKEREKEGDKI